MSNIGEKKKIKIIFVIDDLHGHGVTSSIINLLKIIDSQEKEISLLVLNKSEETGLSRLPSFVNVLKNDIALEAFFKEKKASITELIKLRKWNLFYNRVLVAIESKKYGNTKALQRRWASILSTIKSETDDYDIAIGFQDYFSGVYALSKIHARVYIGWNHNIYQQMGYDDSLMRKYYERLNYICTISNATKSSLQMVFGNELLNKLYIVPNAVDKQRIEEQKNEIVNDPFFDSGKKKLLSIGRLVEQKGFDFAIEIANELRRTGLDFIWYIVGDGIQKEMLYEQICSNNLNEFIKLYGFSDNPYPFLAKCDVYVQPSRYEGYGIAISEAVYLQRPVVITPDAGERYRPSKVIKILDFGNATEWARAIEEILSIVELSEEELYDENQAVITAFNRVINTFADEKKE